MSKFVRSNGPGSGRLPGIQPQRLYGDQVALGEPFHLKGNTELERDIQSSLEIIAQERLLEVEAQAKSLIVRAREEAAKILEKANAQAKAMIDQAQGEVDGIRENAHEEGFKTGYAEGYNDATTQVTEETQALLAGAQTLVDGAYLAEQRVMKHFESRTMELIRHIARQIINRELTDSPATVMGMVQRAISSLYLSGKVQVVVSAQVIHDLRHYASATEQSLDGMTRFEFVADPALDRHQIYIIGQEGCFDLSPDTQLDHLLSVIESELKLPREIPEPQQDIPEPQNTAQLISDQESFQADVKADASVIAIDSALPNNLVEAPEVVESSEISNEVIATASVDRTGPVESRVSESESPESAIVPNIPQESDPVAWDEFPAELKQQAGLSAGGELEELSEDLLADEISVNSLNLAEDSSEPTLEETEPDEPLAHASPPDEDPA